MVRIRNRTIDDFIVKAQDVLQNSLIETSHSFTYQTGTLNYALPGFSEGDERIYSIESIEGVGYLPEDYLTEDDLIENVDYSLYDNYTSPEIVPDGYGLSSGEQVYTGITISDQTFKDGSTVFVKYKYQNIGHVPILTNFSPNSVLRMILTSSLLNIQLTNSELTESINNFGLNASGEDLERIATLVGIERTDAEFTTGQVKVTNNDSVRSYNITTSHRFAAISGDDYLAFAPLTSATVPTNESVFIDVEAVEAGSYYNVGSNSISIGFTNIDLTSRTPDTIVINNPALGDLGQQNLFNNGSDEETDSSFRKRISLAFSQAKTSSYSTIENAVVETNLVSDAKTYDIETKKNLNENQIQTYVSTDTGAKLSSSALSQITNAISEVKPVGSISSVRETLNTYINFDFTIYINQDDMGNTTPIENNLNDLLNDFINNKNIGDDILPSSIVSILKAVSEVRDLEINSYTVTEFSSEVATYDSQIDLATNGDADNYVAIEVPFNSATHLTYAEESTISEDSYDLEANGEPYPVDDRTAPRVNIGVTAYDGIVRPSPLDRTNYRLSGSRSTITYEPDTDGGDGIKTTDLVLFNYNYFDNMKLDGFRIRLGGDSDQQIVVDFGYGSDPNNFTSLITPVTVTLDGTEKIYDVPLSSQLDCDNYPTYSPDSNSFWLIIYDDESGSGDSYLPVDSEQNFVQFNPRIWEDPDADGVTFETDSSKRANWYSYTKFTDADAYKKIVIPSQTDEPEKPLSYTHTYSFEIFTEE